MGKVEVWDLKKVGPGTIGIKIRGRACKRVPTYNHNLSKVKLAAPQGWLVFVRYEAQDRP